MDTSMSSDNTIYGHRSNGKAHGDVYTKLPVVQYMLDCIGYLSTSDLSEVRITDPSCGLGAFLFEIVNRLYESSQRFGFSFREALYQNIRAYDIDEKKLIACTEYLALHYANIDISRILFHEDYLVASCSETDLVVGNPPYVRYEQIPNEEKKKYKRTFYSFHYRPDLYVLFFEKGLSTLCNGGRLCLIAPNRWTRNEYGKKLRRLIAKCYALESFIDMANADPFLEQVLAYPSITTIKKENNSQPKTFLHSVVESISELSLITDHERAVLLPTSDDWSGLFVSNIAGTTTIEQLGFSIGIGAATGADRIFIRNDFPSDIEQELLLPAVNAKNLQGNKITWNGEKLFNPYNTSGQLIDIDMYPVAKKYLVTNKEILVKRYVARKSPARWYKTIDRIKSELCRKNKLLLPEISANKWLVIDEGKFYPLHNVYYIIGRDLRCLRALAAVLVSDLVCAQLDRISVSMNGGYMRWQSQYLRKIRIPSQLINNSEIVAMLESYYLDMDIDSINRIVQSEVDKCTICESIKTNKREVAQQLVLDL